jgi:hypothetical protein
MAVHNSLAGKKVHGMVRFKIVSLMLSICVLETAINTHH